MPPPTHQKLRSGVARGGGDDPNGNIRNQNHNRTRGRDRGRAVPKILLLVSILGTFALISSFMLAGWEQSVVLNDELITKDPGEGLLDTDGDGIADLDENYLYGTDLNNPDTDGDGLPDGWEIRNGLDPRDNGTGKIIDSDVPVDTDGPTIPGFPNNTQGMTGDPDRDGLTNLEEFEASTIFGRSLDPLNPDTDGDGMEDGWEVDHRVFSELLKRWTLNATDPSDGVLDPDIDGLTNLQEFLAGTDPNELDTDRDGLSDYREVVQIHSDPNSNDTDEDGLPDKWEVDYGLNASDPKDAHIDSDGDGLTNKEEYGLRVEYGNWTNPSGLDRNGDGAPDGFDTDGDKMPDGWEVIHSLHPLDTTDAEEDNDKDGFDANGNGLLEEQEYFTNREEYEVVLHFGKSTDPNDNDTDDDGIDDGVEIYGWPIIVNAEETWVVSNPHLADTDEDGLSDREEKDDYHTNTSLADTDSDTLSDYREVHYLNTYQNFTYKTNATARDTDGDLLDDNEEVALGLDGYLTNGTNPDSDADGLMDGEETLFPPRPFQTACDPTEKDTDRDGIEDGWELNVGRPNPGLGSGTGTSTGTGTGPGTGTGYASEAAANYASTSVLIAVDPWSWEGTNMSAGCWLWDYTETWYSLGNLSRFHFPANLTFGWLIDPTHGWDRDSDPDGDTLTNFEESPNGWNINPIAPDTDNDNLPDGWEVDYTKWDPIVVGWLLDPARADSDGDGTRDGDEDPDNDGYDIDHDGSLSPEERFTNYYEYLTGTDPTNPDTDGDEVNDGYEVYFMDSDSDGMADGWERDHDLDPFNAADAEKDADLDGYTNLEEYLATTDPNDGNSNPGSRSGFCREGQTGRGDG